MACHTRLPQHCLHIHSRMKAHVHMSDMQPLALGAAMAAGAQAHIDIHWMGSPDARAMNNPAYYQHSEESKKLAMVRALQQAGGLVWDRSCCCCCHAEHLQEHAHPSAEAKHPCGSTQAATC